MYPTLHIGPLALQTPGLALLIGVWAGSMLSEREAARQKINPSEVYNLIFTGLIVGLVAARLVYAARHLSAFMASPLSLILPNFGTLAPAEGLLAGIAAAYLYAAWKKFPIRRFLDALAPGFAAFMISLGLAHLLGGDAFGAPARLPWSIYLWGEYRHPSQIYETLAAAIILLIILKRPFEAQGEGLNFWLVVALSALARIFLETFRGDSAYVAGGFRSAQIIGLVVLAASLYMLNAWRQKPQSVPAPETVRESPIPPAPPSQEGGK